MSTILKKGKTIILLAVLCFLMNGFCAGEAFAATHSIENGHLDRTMLVGETAETDTLLSVWSISGKQPMSQALLTCLAVIRVYRMTRMI